MLATPRAPGRMRLLPGAFGAFLVLGCLVCAGRGTNRVLYRDAFERADLGADWRPAAGKWGVQDGRLAGVLSGGSAVVRNARALPAEFRFEVDVTFAAGDEREAEVFFGERNTEGKMQGRGVRIVFGGRDELKAEMWQGAASVAAFHTRHSRTFSQQTYHLSVLARHGVVVVLLDARQILRGEPTVEKGFTTWGLGARGSGAFFDNLAVLEAESDVPSLGHEAPRPARDRTRAGLARNRDDVLLYCSFENGLAADYAVQNALPLKSKRLPRTAPDRGGKVLYMDGNSFQYDACGQIFQDRGTVAFWFKLHKPPVHDYWDLFAASSGLAGNGGAALRMNWYYVNFFLSISDAAGHGERFKRSSILRDWKKDEWIHLVLTWNQFRGGRLYENGKRRSTTYFFHGDHNNWRRPNRVYARWAVPALLDRIGFGHQTSGRRYGAGSRNVSFDDVYIFSEELTPEEIADLYAGEILPRRPVAKRSPRLSSDDMKFLLQTRSWIEPYAAALPSIEMTASDQGPAPLFRKSRVRRADDAKRPIWTPFDGERGSRWPHPSYRSEFSGRSLDVELMSGEKIEFAQIRFLGYVPFKGALVAVGSGGQEIERLALDSGTGAPPAIWPGPDGTHHPVSDASQRLEACLRFSRPLHIARLRL